LREGGAHVARRAQKNWLFIAESSAGRRTRLQGTTA
jgi:hypothetical protein